MMHFEFESALTINVFFSSLSLGSIYGYELQQVTGDVYRFKAFGHYSLVVITNDGVVVVDPINRVAAGNLMKLLPEVTDQPITHLLYSHSHFDHAAGGAQFGPLKEVVVQKNALENMYGVEPTIRFDDEYQFELGGKKFELTWLGVGEGVDLSAIIVRPENVAFLVDVFATKRLFYMDMPGGDLDGWLKQLKKIETLEFDIAAPGHGVLGKKADVKDVRIYMEKLFDQVSAGLKEGKSVEELQESITMDEYKDWEYYDSWLNLNISGMARYLQNK